MDFLLPIVPSLVYARETYTPYYNSTPADTRRMPCRSTLSCAESPRLQQWSTWWTDQWTDQLKEQLCGDKSNHVEQLVKVCEINWDIGCFQKTTKHSPISLTLPAVMSLISILWHSLVLNCSVWNCILHPNLCIVL